MYFSYVSHTATLSEKVTRFSVRCILLADATPLRTATAPPYTVNEFATMAATLEKDMANELTEPHDESKSV